MGDDRGFYPHLCSGDSGSGYTEVLRLRGNHRGHAILHPFMHIRSD